MGWVVFPCHRLPEDVKAVNVRVTIVLVFMLQMLIGCGDASDSWPMTRFDQTKWSQTDEGNRFVFVRNLIEGKKLENLTKQQVLDLLGKPSYDDINGEYVTYVVKTSSGNVHILDIRFKENRGQKIVAMVGVRTD